MENIYPFMRLIHILFYLLKYSLKERLTKNICYAFCDEPIKYYISKYLYIKISRTLHFSLPEPSLTLVGSGMTGGSMYSQDY